MPYEYEKKYKPGQLLDASQAAEVVSENSGKQIPAINIAATLARHDVQPANKVGSSNQYKYDEVCKVKVRPTSGRPPLKDGGLTASERMRRSRSGKSSPNQARGKKRGAAAPGASGSSDPGDGGHDVGEAAGSVPIAL